MPKTKLEIEIDDSEWPYLTFALFSPTGARQDRRMYDIAAVAFEPHARDAIRMACDSIIKAHKQKLNPNQT